MKNTLSLIFLLAACCSYTAESQNYTIKKVPVTIRALGVPDPIEFERPFNIFLSAGIGYRLEEVYDATVSPSDHTVQFESLGPWTTAISAGIVWNPFKPAEDSRKGLYLNDSELKEYLRGAFAVALLVDVFKLSFSDQDIKNGASPDVGIGIGFRRWDFMVLLTADFNYLNQPRSYFLDNFDGKPIMLDGSAEPATVLDPTDSRLFHNKVVPSFGLKLAYAFTKKPNK